jgi:peptidoglycan-N-acetylglucosamine deacetylase
MIKMKRYGLVSIALFIAINVLSQKPKTWLGKKAAVVLTYDDAMAQHLDNAIPALDSLGLKATFYLSAYYPASRDRMLEWKKAAVKGHELANHTLFHPCVGGKGREWVKPDYDLRTYTVQRMVDEIRMTNVFLESIDGRKKRTFAFPCADTKINDTTYIDGLKNNFIAARNVRGEFQDINKVDLYDVSCFMINGETGDEMIAMVKQAMEKNALIVFLFHGVDGGNSLNVSLTAHRQLLRFLKQNQDDLWVAPMLEVAEHIKKHQQAK